LTEPLTIKEFADIGLANSPVLLTALAEQLPAPKQLELVLNWPELAEASEPFCVADLL
jgi:hypothetical protein